MDSLVSCCPDLAVVEAAGPVAEAGRHNHSVLTNKNCYRSDKINAMEKFASQTTQSPSYLRWSGHGLTPGGYTSGDLAPGPCEGEIRKSEVRSEE